MKPSKMLWDSGKEHPVFLLEGNDILDKHIIKVNWVFRKLRTACHRAFSFSNYIPSCTLDLAGDEAISSSAGWQKPSSTHHVRSFLELASTWRFKNKNPVSCKPRIVQTPCYTYPWLRSPMRLIVCYHF